MLSPCSTIDTQAKVVQPWTDSAKSSVGKQKEADQFSGSILNAGVFTSTVAECAHRPLSIFVVS